jgi:hypothetical protein
MKVEVSLTDAQCGTLLALLRKEAQSLGYKEDGTGKYNFYNKKTWPARLKTLSTIAHQLWVARASMPKTVKMTREQQAEFDEMFGPQ